MKSGSARILKYVPGAVVPAASSFAFTLALARVLSPSDLGLVAVGLSLSAICSGAGAQWIAQPVIRFFSDRIDGAALLTATRHLTMVACLISGGVAGVLLWMFARPFVPVGGLIKEGVAVAALTSASIISSVGLAVLQATARIGDYSISQMRFHVSRLSVAVFCSALIPSAEVALIGASIGSWGAVLVDGNMRTLLKPEAANRGSIAAWRSRLRGYGLPFIPWSLFSTFLAVGDRLVLAQFVSPDQVGIYAVHYTIATGAITLLAMPFLLYAHPEIMRLWRNGEFAAARRIASRYASLIAVASAVSAVGAFLIGERVVQLVMGAEFAGPTHLLWILCAGIGFWQVALYLQKPMEAAGSTRRLAVLIALAAVVNAIAIVTLVPLLGVIGAACATALSYAVYSSSLWLLSWGSTKTRKARYLFLVACAALLVFVLTARKGSEMLEFGALVSILYLSSVAPAALFLESKQTRA